MAKKVAASRPRKRQTRKERLKSRREARAARRARPVQCPNSNCGSRQAMTIWYGPVDREHYDQVRCEKCGQFYSRSEGWEAAGDYEPEPERSGGRGFRRGGFQR
jgi:hypothetical protein